MEVKEIIGKIIIVISAILFGLIGVLRCMEKSQQIQHYILSGYFVLFGAVLITAAIPIEFMVKYFSFLKGKVGIGIFMIFLGLLIFNWNAQLELVASLVLILSGAFHIIT